MNAPITIELGASKDTYMGVVQGVFKGTSTGSVGVGLDKYKDMSVEVGLRGF